MTLFIYLSIGFIFCIAGVAIANYEDNKRPSKYYELVGSIIVGAGVLFAILAIVSPSLV